MRKILLSLITILAVAGIAVNSTAAYFNDTETSTGNSVSAGTLDLKVNDNDDPVIESIQISNIKPGDTISKIWKLKNVGSVPGKVKITVKNIVDNDNSCSDPESPAEVSEYGSATCGDAEGELSTYLRTQVIQSHVNVTSPIDWSISDYHANRMTGRHPSGSPFGGLKYQENKVMNGQSLSQNDYQMVQLIMKLDADVISDSDWGGWPVHQVDDNLIQSDTTTFNVEFSLEQI